MTDRKFYPLLIAWTILTIAPGMLVTLGVFGHVGLTTNVNGPAMGLWIGGWLAQFAAFFWLMAVAKKQNILWWFIASLLPYAIDWVTPVSPIALVVFPLLAVATAVWIAMTEHSYEDMTEHGIRATGVVLQIYQPMMNVIINGAYIKRKLRLRIERSDGAAPYEATYNGLFMFGDIPDVGARIPFLVDPSNPQHLQYRDADDADSTAPSDSGYRSSTANDAAADAASGDLAGDLDRLSKLRDKGALTNDEFAAAKKKLLDG